MVIGIDVRLWDQTGVGRYTRNLVICLLKIDKKNDYVLFSRPQDNEIIESQINRGKLKDSKVKIINTDIPWHSLKEQIEFPKVLNRQKLDLVHFPYISAPIFYSNPFIITIHDLIPYYFSTGRASKLPFPLYQIKRLGYKFVLKNAVLNSKKIIVPSNSVKNELQKNLKISGDKIFVTHEGVDSEIINKGLDIKSKENEKYFLYVGNAYPHKNLETLLLSFSKLRQKEKKLIIVGKEDFFLKRIRKFADKLGILENIVFKGKASDDELSVLYSNALCLIVPSFSEGFSLSVLEAMSLKCRVILSDIPTHREIAKDTCLYFDPTNSDDLKNKMEDVFKGIYPDGKILEAFTRSGEFSFEKMAKETLKIYEGSISI